MRLPETLWPALIGVAAFVSTVAAAPVLPPVLSARDTNGSVPCNASCVHSLVRKTSYASAAVGMALTMMEYNSLDWCMAEEQVSWCPPTIEAVLDSIAVKVSAMAAFNDTDNGNCNRTCLRLKVELASRRSAVASMLWAKHKVAGDVQWDVDSTVGPDKIDWNIRLLAPSENFTQELLDDIATTNTNIKRSIFGRLTDALRQARSANRDSAARTGAMLLETRSNTDESAGKQSFWQPRMQYLLSAPSRMRRDNWLTLPEVRTLFAEVLDEIQSAHILRLESSWMKYLIEHWMTGPPTSQPVQYLDYIGINTEGKTLPAEPLRMIRAIEPNATVWRWIHDFDEAKVMEPFEGRPDSSNNPSVMLRGYMMSFADERSTDPFMEAPGSKEKGPIIRPAWPFERTLGQASAPMRLLHLWPIYHAINWQAYNLTGGHYDTPPGMTAWEVLDGMGNTIPDGTDGTYYSLPVVLGHGSIKAKTKYLDAPSLWGDKYLGSNGTAAFCDSSCFAYELQNASSTAARAAAYATLTVYGAADWCWMAEKDWCPGNITAIADGAALTAARYGQLVGQSCTDQACQGNASARAYYRAEITAMTLTKKALLPHLGALNITTNTSSALIDLAISESLLRYQQFDPLDNSNSTDGSEQAVASSKSSRSLLLSRADKPANPLGPWYKRIWQSWKQRLSNLLKRLRGGKGIEDLNEEGYSDISESSVDELDEALDREFSWKPGEQEGRVDQWLDDVDEAERTTGWESAEQAPPEDLPTQKWDPENGRLVEKMDGWTEEELGYDPAKGPLRAMIEDQEGLRPEFEEGEPAEWEPLDTTLGHDPQLEANRALDDIQTEDAADAAARPAEAWELEQDELPLSESNHPTESGYGPEGEGEPALERPPGFELDGAPETAPELDVNWSPDYMPPGTGPGTPMHPTTSTNANPTTEEFEDALEDGDPEAMSEVGDFGVDGAEAAAMGGEAAVPEMAEAAVAAEEVAMEAVAEGSVAVFAEGGIEAGIAIMAMFAL